jgi:hypothetical protein
VSSASSITAMQAITSFISDESKVGYIDGAVVGGRKRHVTFTTSARDGFPFFAGCNVGANKSSSSKTVGSGQNGS